MEAIWPMRIKGVSTGCPPIHVSVIRSATRIQNRHWLIGRNVRLRKGEVWSNGSKTKIKIDSTKAITPPSLLGIERKMA